MKNTPQPTDMMLIESNQVLLTIPQSQTVQLFHDWHFPGVRINIQPPFTCTCRLILLCEVLVHNVKKSL